MRTAIAIVTVLALVLPLEACSSGQSQARPRTNAVATYGPGSQSGNAPATTSFHWYTKLADAQAAARAQGKLILAASTRPGCGLCEKFKNRVVPQVASECSRVAVGYVYDIVHPEAPAVDQTLRANLTDATLMPLVGFLTPELRWVHGFWGSTDAEKFLGDLAVAQRIYPVSATALRTNVTYEGRDLVAVVNEFGETEWSRPGDVWPEGAPEPEDAIEGAPRLDDVPARPAEHLADATPAPAPAPAPAEVDPFAPVEPTAAVAAQPLAAPEAIVIEESEPTPAVARQPNPPFSQPEREDARLADWAEEQLDLALLLIERGEYDQARETLEVVKARVPDSVLAREAARGSVAIYNHKRIRSTSGSEQERYKKRAARDLGGSMWGSLFS
jgi:hypothetical protein